MLVGVLIALLQALTQVQEMTLTFIPKIIAVLVVAAFTAPFMGGQILAFTENGVWPHRHRLLEDAPISSHALSGELHTRALIESAPARRPARPLPPQACASPPAASARSAPPSRP